MRISLEKYHNYRYDKGHARVRWIMKHQNSPACTETPELTCMRGFLNCNWWLVHGHMVCTVEMAAVSLGTSHVRAYQRYKRVHHFSQYLYRSQELRESRGGRPGLPESISPHSRCGRKATLN